MRTIPTQDMVEEGGNAIRTFVYLRGRATTKSQREEKKYGRHCLKKKVLSILSRIRVFVPNLTTSQPKHHDRIVVPKVLGMLLLF